MGIDDIRPVVGFWTFWILGAIGAVGLVLSLVVLIVTDVQNAGFIGSAFVGGLLGAIGFAIAFGVEW